MFSLKLKYQNEVRRVQMPGQADDMSFQQLLTTATSIFPSLTENQDISFLWTDDENDVIGCNNDQEIHEALRVMKSEKKTTFKFEVHARNVTRSDSGPSSNEVHDGVQCDGCGVSPLVGVRFKCAVRDNFDLCETCEAKDESKFPMLKINNAEQAPVKLIVVLKDENGQAKKFFQGPGPRGPHGPPGPRRFWGPFGPRGPGPYRGPFGVNHGHGHFGHHHSFHDPHGFVLPVNHCGRDPVSSPPDIEPTRDGASCEAQGPIAPQVFSPLFAMADAFISSLKENEPVNSAPATPDCAGAAKCDFSKDSGLERGSNWIPQHRRGRCRGRQPCVPSKEDEEARLVQLALKESKSRSEREIEEDRLIEEALRESLAGESSSASPRPTSTAAEEVHCEEVHSQRPVQSESQREEASRAMEPVANSVPTDPTAVWAHVWAKELQVLADMGFADTAALLPLLQEHVGVPVSLCPQLNGVPSAEGMQRLLGALLTQSGMLH